MKKKENVIKDITKLLKSLIVGKLSESWYILKNENEQKYIKKDNNKINFEYSYFKKSYPVRYREI